jgi:hypothetical protein
VNADDRHDRLRALTAEAAADRGRLPEDEKSRAPAGGDLYVLPETKDFPVEWALLERRSDGTGLWLAVPADTNPLRGPGDVAVPADEPGGPLWLRCRFGVRLHPATLARGRRTGALSAEATARTLATWRRLERADLEVDPLAEEVAVDLEYESWQRDVLVPAREAASAAASRFERPRPEFSLWRARPLFALAAVLGLLAAGLGAWAWQLRGRIEGLSAPLLMGGSQEIVLGSDVRAPAVLGLRPTDERLLLFVVLSGKAAEYRRYRLELGDGEGRILWTSPEVERGPVPELNLVIPRRFLDRSEGPLLLRLFGLESGRSRRLAEVPIRVERTDAPPGGVR